MITNYRTSSFSFPLMAVKYFNTTRHTLLPQNVPSSPQGVMDTFHRLHSWPLQQRTTTDQKYTEQGPTIHQWILVGDVPWINNQWLLLLQPSQSPTVSIQCHDLSTRYNQCERTQVTTTNHGKFGHCWSQVLLDVSLVGEPKTFIAITNVLPCCFIKAACRLENGNWTKSGANGPGKW